MQNVTLKQNLNHDKELVFDYEYDETGVLHPVVDVIPKIVRLTDDAFRRDDLTAVGLLHDISYDMFLSGIWDKSKTSSFVELSDYISDAYATLKGKKRSKTDGFATKLEELDFYDELHKNK